MTTKEEVIEKLSEAIPGLRRLTPLEFNEVRFSGRKTVITPRRLRAPASGSVRSLSGESAGAGRR